MGGGLRPLRPCRDPGDGTEWPAQTWAVARCSRPGGLLCSALLAAPRGPPSCPSGTSTQALPTSRPDAVAPGAPAPQSCPPTSPGLPAPQGHGTPDSALTTAAVPRRLLPSAICVSVSLSVRSFRKPASSPRPSSQPPTHTQRHAALLSPPGVRCLLPVPSEGRLVTCQRPHRGPKACPWGGGGPGLLAPPAPRLRTVLLPAAFVWSLSRPASACTLGGAQPTPRCTRPHAGAQGAAVHAGPGRTPLPNCPLPPQGPSGLGGPGPGAGRSTPKQKGTGALAPSCLWPRMGQPPG